MTQLDMFDLFRTPKATDEMLADDDLIECIQVFRDQVAPWQHVERICECNGHPVWAVDDDGHRYVVVREPVWELYRGEPRSVIMCVMKPFFPEVMKRTDPVIRLAARAAFARLDKVA
ncbi:hypothetical protein ACVI1J_001699 [Bradyrhizobium diazoefficiens]